MVKPYSALYILFRELFRLFTAERTIVAIELKIKSN